ncbi:uncharacterized protein BJ171DRAFT_500640 [Polychytrium aggregatum]|uniref:uncharacterized protein n=1 Tax=Polychytrium aggregatum TaxID=110093 RepID=UPI0022FF03EC|nr:uncharacterized protein BJ171DRAFT_500640 [Polychytrium aggregatum]KAI9205498.1 hypothetical protein BJ171DRAFT_500640 [Polychytrium aggregatum]
MHRAITEHRNGPLEQLIQCVVNLSLSPPASASRRRRADAQKEDPKPQISPETVVLLAEGVPSKMAAELDPTFVRPPLSPVYSKRRPFLPKPTPSQSRTMYQKMEKAVDQALSEERRQRAAREAAEQDKRARLREKDQQEAKLALADIRQKSLIEQMSQKIRDAYVALEKRRSSLNVVSEAAAPATPAPQPAPVEPEIIPTPKQQPARETPSADWNEGYEQVERIVTRRPSISGFVGSVIADLMRESSDRPLTRSTTATGGQHSEVPSRMTTSSRSGHDTSGRDHGFARTPSLVRTATSDNSRSKAASTLQAVPEWSLAGAQVAESREGIGPADLSERGRQNARRLRESIQRDAEQHGQSTSSGTDEQT